MRPPRVLLVLLLAAVVCVPALGKPARSTPIRELKVIVHTGEDFGAGTHDAVWFSLGPSYEWSLEQMGGQPFQSGHYDTFHLGPNGLNEEDIKYIRLRKGAGGDRWLLQGIEVWINGKPYYRNPNIGTWLGDGSLQWTAPHFPVATGARKDGPGPHHG